MDRYDFSSSHVQIERRTHVLNSISNAKLNSLTVELGHNAFYVSRSDIQLPLTVYLKGTIR